MRIKGLLINRKIILTVIIAVQNTVNLIGRRVHICHGGIMVHKINDGRQEFAHIRFNVIRTGFQFRNPVRQVSGYNSVKTALFIGFVKAGKTFRKKSESTEDKDSN